MTAPFSWYEFSTGASFLSGTVSQEISLLNNHVTFNFFTLFIILQKEQQRYGEETVKKPLGLYKEVTSKT